MVSHNPSDWSQRCPNHHCARTIEPTLTFDADQYSPPLTTCPHCQRSLLVGRHYRLLTALAEGGMGRTFLAQDQRFLNSVNEKCVLKEIKAEDPARFVPMLKQEAGRLLSLRHPHIPAYRDFFEEKDDSGASRWFLVQEFIEGDDLQARLEQDGPCPVPEALDILCNVLKRLMLRFEVFC